MERHFPMLFHALQKSFFETLKLNSWGQNEIFLENSGS